MPGAEVPRPPPGRRLPTFLPCPDVLEQLRGVRLAPRALADTKGASRAGPINQPPKAVRRSGELGMPSLRPGRPGSDLKRVGVRCRVALQLLPGGRRELHFHTFVVTSTWTGIPVEISVSCCRGCGGFSMPCWWRYVAMQSSRPRTRDLNFILWMPRIRAVDGFYGGSAQRTVQLHILGPDVAPSVLSSGICWLTALARSPTRASGAVGCDRRRSSAAARA